MIASWAEPSRRYHDLDHLCDVLRSVDQLAAHAADPTAVRLAAWYHDVAHHGRSDDELASAARAERELFDLDVEHSLVTEVARLVRLTATHDPGPGDRNGETLCDADLRILASPADRYARYVAAVRAEYAHVPDAQFVRAALPCSHRCWLGQHCFARHTDTQNGKLRRGPTSPPNCALSARLRASSTRVLTTCTRTPG